MRMSDGCLCGCSGLCGRQSGVSVPVRLLAYSAAMALRPVVVLRLCGARLCGSSGLCGRGGLCGLAACAAAALID